MAEKSQFSPSWYRVADLTPRLRAHVEIHRRQFRGDIWYVLEDAASNRFHRFSPAAYTVIAQMDGKRPMREIWKAAARKLGHDLPTQDEVIQLLSQLHQADALDSGAPPDITELAERARSQRRRELMQRVQNPMAIRIPLLDPDRFLDATFPLVRPLISWLGLVLWLGLVGWALVATAQHWPLLTENLTDRVLSAQNIALILLSYPVIKGIHELGHGYAVKRWGGEVHEMGIMFLVFMPVPYVEASAAAAFRSKWQRAFVAGAGIMVEVTLAAIALAVWLNVEPGLVRTIAFNTMLIAGVSTVLFNGNPLLRFDGYYVLADLLEVPNLGNRSNKHLLHLIQRYGFGLRASRSPATARGERFWFVLYGLAALAYRLFIMTVIVVFVATHFFVVGVLLAIWSATLMLVWPVLKGAWFVLTSPRLDRVRGRAMGVTLGALGAIGAALALIPLPHATLAQGVLWIPDHAVVHAQGTGTVVEIIAPPNSQVAPGDPLLRLEDPLIRAEIGVVDARIAELRLTLAAVEIADRVEAARMRERLGQAERGRARLAERQEGLALRSTAQGVFVLPDADDLPGRFIRQGQPLGYVVEGGTPVIRTLVSDRDIDLVRHRTRDVQVRFADRLDDILPAQLRAQTPAATRHLVSPVLSDQGGGPFALDPAGESPLQALQTVFQIDVALDQPLDRTLIGGRAHVRFDLGAEPLGYRLWRSTRQIFLRTFRV
ncbi:peptidase M50 [Rhodobacteraceae bacterium 2376]|uniref:Peptidase M50 n=1 Tax=Rhabdonatronobacter sediminivivens TaxID=2743469 RepID=A0A7Z0I144_9RHOB|nr:peptidase M50 [Rhabdonatronobacter sediminivivens]NYS26011.1 peptidase M50 [Rhabdonatronobacter sediminivivens]